MLEKFKIGWILIMAAVLSFACQSSLYRLGEPQVATPKEEPQIQNLQTLDDLYRHEEKKKQDQEMLSEAKRLLKGAVKLHLETAYSIPAAFAVFGMDRLSGIFDSVISWDDGKDALVIKPLHAKPVEDLEFIFREFKVKSVDGTRVSFFSPFEHQLALNNEETGQTVEENWNGSVFFEVDVASDPVAAQFAVDFTYSRTEGDFHETQKLQAQWNVTLDRDLIDENDEDGDVLSDNGTDVSKTTVIGSDETDLIEARVSFAGATFAVEETTQPVRLEIYRKRDGTKLMDVTQNVFIGTGPVIENVIFQHGEKSAFVDVVINEENLGLQGFVKLNDADEIGITYFFSE
ncbi:MAG: hypothetical protein HYS98_06580 [Deltaproteobacteria bacterium]|nr:hypothetical protein [Deltaproteobacteria bacterium]